MAKYLQIQVPAPCHENWEQMKATSTGAFCNACEKTVIDFTAMTDNQLLEYFIQHPSGGCGRFYTDQLTHPLEIPVKRIPWLKYFFQISLPALLFSYKANAQRLTKKLMNPVVAVEKKPSLPLMLRTAAWISGKISSEDGRELAFASVMIEGTREGTVADSNGCFTLSLKKNVRYLTVSAAGYISKEVPLTDSIVNSRADIVLTRENPLQPVVVQSMVSTRKGSYTVGFTSRIIIHKRIAAVPEVKTPASLPELFPNPAKRNELLTIRWKKPVSNSQHIILYNAAGMKMAEKIIQINHSTLQTTYNPGMNAAGYYFIHITDSKTRKKHVIPFIIE